MSEDVIKRLMETGKVTLGSETTIKAMRSGKARAVIISSNCPKERELEILELAKSSGIRAYRYPGTSLELGEACGKPFPVSAIAVMDPGDADLTKLGGV